MIERPKIARDAHGSSKHGFAETSVFFQFDPRVTVKATQRKNNAAINALLSMDKSATLKANRQGKITVRNYFAV
jgi:hypothetical protein